MQDEKRQDDGREPGTCHVTTYPAGGGESSERDLEADTAQAGGGANRWGGAASEVEHDAHAKADSPDTRQDASERTLPLGEFTRQGAASGVLETGGRHAHHLAAVRRETPGILTGLGVVDSADGEESDTRCEQSASA